MLETEIYYRFKPKVIDPCSKKQVKKCCKALYFFETIENHFKKLKDVFENRIPERNDLIVNFLHNVGGIVEISVYNKIKYKAFSKSIKERCFCLHIIKIDYGKDYYSYDYVVRNYKEDDNRVYYSYDYKTNDIREVEEIFRKLIEERRIPNLTFWDELKLFEV